VKFFSFARAACVALILVIPLAFASAANAGASPAPSPQPSPSQSPSGALREIGRVVTSDRRGEPISQTSRPTFVVDRARIDAYGARTVADALVGVPGLQLNSYGAFGAQVDYGIRGSTSEQTLVLVDGQPIADPNSGTAYLDGLSTVGVDRIEIVESGSSTLYGTSASGGVINVITRVPSGTSGLVSDGSYSDRDVQASVGNGTIGASYERHVATNDYAYPGFIYGPTACGLAATGPCAIAPASRTNSYALASTGRVSLDKSLGTDFSIRARGDLSSLDIGVPGSLQYGATPADTQGLANYAGLLELAHNGRSSTQTLTLSGANQRLAYDSAAYAEDDAYSGRAQLSLRDASTFGRADLVAGVDLSRESGNFAEPSSTNYGTNPISISPAFAVGARQSQSAAYAQVGYAPITGTRFTGGLRAEHDSPSGSVLAPSFGVVTRLGAFRLSGNLGESFRVPTLDDLYYPGDSNPNLLPEKAATADATVAYDVAGGSVSVGWFGRHGSNFIVLTGPPDYLPFNAQRAVVDGLAVTAQTRPIAGLVADVSFTDLYRAEDLSLGQRLPREPGGQATLGVSRAFGRDRLAYGARWTIVGDDGDDAANVPPPLVNSYDAHDTLDAYLRYRFAKDVIVTARGFNLGDERYVPIFGYPAPGRRLYLEFSTK
jgi:vitamin B12 transporter